MRTGLLLGLGLVACDPTPKPGPPDATPTASASVATPPSAAPSASVRPRVAATGATSPGCRVLAVTGEVMADGERVAAGSVVYGKTWLRLGKGASLSLRHTASTRELALKGPAQALPCLDGEEDTLLGEGIFESTAGAGARPGAEVVIFTPVGTVSYGDAQIIVRTSKTKLELTSSKGEAWALPALGASRKGPEKVSGPKDKVVLTGSGAAEPLVKDCERAAGDAERLGRAVLSPQGDAGLLGDRAAAHLRARRAARGACGAARAASVTEPDADRRAGLERRVEEAGRRWRSLGTPGAPAPKSSGE